MSNIFSHGFNIESSNIGSPNTVSHGLSIRSSNGGDIYNCYPSTYNNLKNKNVEDNHMSFVGLQINPKTRKIIAFADSKSSRLNGAGVMIHDWICPNVNKMFSTDKYIAVAYGANEIQELSGNKKLEDLMLDCKDEPLENVFVKIQHAMRLSMQKDSVYMIYAKKGEIPYHHIVEVNRNHILDEKIYSKEPFSHVGGNESYVKLLEHEPTLSDGSMEEIKALIEKTVAFQDTLKIYNPVGGEIKVQSWDWE